LINKLHRHHYIIYIYYSRNQKIPIELMSRVTLGHFQSRLTHESLSNHLGEEPILCTS